MSRLLRVSNLKVHFPIGKKGFLGRPTGFVKAVDGLSFDIERGETLGLVGESGSGKTTLGRAILRAIKPTSGEITYEKDDISIDIMDLNRSGLKGIWRNMQMIFQDPYASLNPRMTVRDIISEPLLANKLAKGKDLNDQVIDMAELCGLNTGHLNRFPHAFSGGQRQRIAIARALILHPEFIVCDEAVSALDVSIQAQILNLLKELQMQLKLTYLFIAHDLSAVAYACDRVAVMYLGQIIEIAPTEKLYYSPAHPYTEALMSAIPEANPSKLMQPVLLSGERPSPSNPPAGCRFHNRCQYATDVCQSEMPVLRKILEEHQVACHHSEKLNLKGALEHGVCD